MRSMRSPLVDDRMISRARHGGPFCARSQEVDRIRVVRRAILGLIVLARHPTADVRGTVAKDDTSASFVLSQKADCIVIREDQIHKI